MKNKNNYINDVGKIKTNLIANFQQKKHRSYETVFGKKSAHEYDFIFSRKFDEFRYDKKIADNKAYEYIINKKFDLTWLLFKELERTVRYNANYIFGIIGDTGYGKSELAMLIIKKVLQIHKKHNHNNIKYFLGFTKDDLLDCIEKSSDYDIIWMDEYPKTTGTGSLKQRWNIENILGSIRAKKNIFLFLNPIIDIKLANIYLETAGMDYNKKVNRFAVLDKNGAYFGHIYFKIHNDNAMRNWYLPLKHKYIEEDMKKNRGKIEVKKEEFNPAAPEELNDQHQFLIDNYNHKDKYRDIEIYFRTLKKENIKYLESVYGISNSTVRRSIKRVDDFLNDHY